MSLEAILPDGTVQLLTSVPRYDVNWQLTYSYKTPPAFPAGTVMHMTSYHDNSAGNRNNPGPTMWIGSGLADHRRDGHCSYGLDLPDRRRLPAARVGADTDKPIRCWRPCAGDTCSACLLS